MDPEFIDYYQRQLTYIQGAFSEFAQEHPKIAARLGAQAGDVRDPHVARLLEAFAWSAARSEQRIDRWPLELPLRILDGIDLSRPYPKRDYQRQFWMSDWDYLNLLWQEWGICFYWENDTLVLMDAHGYDSTQKGLQRLPHSEQRIPR
ncbi:type VI secretion system baseplate subunit TssF [Paraburkholderia tropica]|uniref:Phage late control gene D protein (GPD) n=1 Tax=Paraburkholderia tropica TaxID=92647 RepID=A0AAQ1GFR2_9BURK|nr:type VI secretion system baseplate subunit TssF [Paraburkholderia tropica]RQN39316.1 hypothetical protein EHZ25_08645 [Paraburkholderia tropica]SEJ70023.1 Phage late control gene D protein (GPD) [Paraburkholderia tropica]